MAAQKLTAAEALERVRALRAESSAQTQPEPAADAEPIPAELAEFDPAIVAEAKRTTVPGIGPALLARRCRQIEWGAGCAALDDSPTDEERRERGAALYARAAELQEHERFRERDLHREHGFEARRRSVVSAAPSRRPSCGRAQRSMRERRERTTSRPSRAGPDDGESEPAGDGDPAGNTSRVANRALAPLLRGGGGA